MSKSQGSAGVVASCLGALKWMMMLSSFDPLLSFANGAEMKDDEDKFFFLPFFEEIVAVVLFE